MYPQPFCGWRTRRCFLIETIAVLSAIPFSVGGTIIEMSEKTRSHLFCPPLFLGDQDEAPAVLKAKHPNVLVATFLKYFTEYFREGAKGDVFLYWNEIIVAPSQFLW